MRRLLWSLLLLPALAGAAAAPKSKVLPNGLEVLVVEDHALPLVTIEIAVKNGSFTEPPEYNGLSHLYEHMFFKANAVLPTQEAYMARLRELGITFNGTTSTERVNYFFTTTSDHFADAMVFMRDAITTPLFDPKELERERVVVTGEIDRNEANPFYPFSKAMDQRVWWKYPSRKRPIGERQTVLAATVEQMKTIKERYYVPNNSALVVAGDVKAEDVFAQAEQLYAGWKRAAEPFVKFPVPRHPAIKKTEVLVMEQPQVRTVNLQFVWHGPSVGPGPEQRFSYPADLLGLATAEPSSKFQKNLVDSGLCVRAGISWYTQVYTGPITLAAEALPEKAQDCARALLAELPKMKAPDYLTAEEMQNAAFREEVSRIMSREEVTGYVHELTFWWTTAGLDYYATYVDRLRAVKPADIASFISTYTDRRPFVFGAIVSPEAAKEHKLDRAAFEKALGVKR